MLPEYRYNKLAELKYFFQLIGRKIGINNNFIDYYANSREILFQLILAIDDAIDFYGITRNKFFYNVSKWPFTEEKLFKESVALKEFYESWEGEIAVENICANIFNQFIFFQNYNVCAKYSLNSKLIIDYGCGSGALSMGLALNNKIKNKLILLDVPNEIRKFREFRINKHKLINIEQDNVLDPKISYLADLIICLDVLEHLENSSEILENQISVMLKTGGFLILKAPWRGQITHIDAAADNFYLNNGRKFLSKNFKEVYRFGPSDICCVYQKN